MRKRTYPVGHYIMTRCVRCNAHVSVWELHSATKLGGPTCWCEGVPAATSRTLANLAYAELCHTGLAKPVKIHDIVRFVSHDHTGNFRYSINVALSKDKRFCWGGRALYGLARHGLIPGARTLAEAAYAILLAAQRQLYIEEVDFVLEQLNYRFNSDSLAHHLRGYTNNRWNLIFELDHLNRVKVNTGRDARRKYNTNVHVCPTHVGFDGWLENDLAPKVQRILDDRTQRLAELKSGKIDIAGDRIEFK